MITNLEEIKTLGEINEDENYQFRVYLKGQKSFKTDKIVHGLYKKFSKEIDCTTCGNCCLCLKTGVNENEIIRLSGILNISVEKMREQYIEKFDRSDSLKNLPCIFLKDLKCSIYESRPGDCKSYPHLHKKDITSRLLSVIGNYSECPIVFNVFEELKTEYNFRNRNMAKSNIPFEIQKQASKMIYDFNEKHFAEEMNVNYFAEFKGKYLYLNRYEGKLISPVARLEYTGNMDEWEFAIFKWSTEKYDPDDWFFPGSELADGTIEGAMDAGLEAYPV